MEFNTKHFGLIEYDESRVISFGEGIPGAEHLKKFIMICPNEEGPFYWIQSLEDEQFALVLSNPFEILPEYDPEISKTILNEMGIEKKEELAILAVTVIPQDIRRMTVNLMAPIVFNTKKHIAKQVILNDDKYDIRHPVFSDAEFSLVREAK
jgi:flagellar assembly factor FliW